ncbi:unnamed protein product [Withania somnifera]
MEKRENEDRYATFSKHQSDLYEKTSQLIGEYGIDVGLILSSPTCESFSFIHPTADAIIDHFSSPFTQPSESGLFAIENSQNKVKELKVEFDRLDSCEKILSNQTPNPNPDETDMKHVWGSIKEYNGEQVKQLEDWLKFVDLNLNNSLMSKQNGASSAQAPPENAN